MKLLTADNVKLGFIGLGNMGSRIARRIALTPWNGPTIRMRIFLLSSAVWKNSLK